MTSTTNGPCACGSGRKYKKCCRPLHRGRPAPTPETLMRSRFSAFALGLAEYLADTTHPGGPQWQSDREPWLAELRAFAAAATFADLEVVGGTVEGERGTVFYRCVVTHLGEAHRFLEHSVFLRYGDRWLYHSGETETR
jgi:SEC-C motif domain protein